MAFCSNCGAELGEGIKFCQKCGSEDYAERQNSFSDQGTQNASLIDKSGHATASLVLGIIGLIAWFIPLLGFPVTIVGLIFGVLGQKSSKKAIAVAGLVLSIVGLVVTIINSAIGAYQGATGTHPLLY